MIKKILKRNFRETCAFFSIAICCTSGCFVFMVKRKLFFQQGVQVPAFWMFRHGGEFDRQNGHIRQRNPMREITLKIIPKP